MQLQEYFRLNGVDVGFSALTDVRVCHGRVHINLNTPPIRLTEALHGGLLAHAWRPIANFYMANGLTVATYEDLALPNGAYGHSVCFPYLDDAKYLQNVCVYGSQGSPNFFGTITVHEGWIAVDGLVTYESEPDPTRAMSIEARKRFDALPLLPPRKKISLTQALKLPPHDVYCLAIENAQRLKSFPSEIFTFKNLESLCFAGDFSAQHVALPEALFALTQLHTLNLQWAGFTVGALSDQIAQLTKLETLRLSSNRVTTLPDSMAALTRLEYLDVSHNALTYLSDCIGELPALRTLVAEGNHFQSLPKSLVNIASVRVNHACRSLFRDVSYRRKINAPVDACQFMLHAKPDWLAATEQQLKNYSSDEALNACALSAATRALYAEATIARIPVSLGASKTGGAPHLPSGVAHPRDANNLLPTFYAQINLQHIAALQGWLPRTGMLYFFLDDFRYGEGACVVYANVDVNDLVAHAYAPNARWVNSDVDAFDDDGQHNLARESSLEFSAGVSLPYVYRAAGEGCAPLESVFERGNSVDRIRLERFDEALESTRAALEKIALSPRQTTHSMNALLWSDDDTSQEQAANAKGGFAREWINLLTLKSVDDYCFGDAGSITFCIHVKDLAAADFSNVVCVVGH